MTPQDRDGHEAEPSGEMRTELHDLDAVGAAGVRGEGLSLEPPYSGGAELDRGPCRRGDRPTILLSEAVPVGSWPVHRALSAVSHDARC